MESLITSLMNFVAGIMVSIVVLASLSLVLQIAALTIITVGYLLKRKGRFLSHATLMLIAVGIHCSSFVFLMGPALFSLYQNGFILTLTSLSITAVIHAIFGSITLLLGVWLVVMWHLQKSTASCVRRRLVMRYVFVLWVVSLAIGFLVYLLLYFHP